jgi:hypothetical protein
VAALGVGWGTVELAGRLVFGLRPVADDRVALFTSPNWVADGRSVRWSPNTRIRTVAIYGDRVEYDVRFETNNLGYIDHRDYGAVSAVPTSHRWAFVGDSLTAGHHGGVPWVPQLRDAASGIEIYNLGVSGAGIGQFLPNLNAADRRLDFANVVFLLISDDLRRRPWRPVEADGRIVLCPLGVNDVACAQSTTPMFVLRDPDASHAEIFASLERKALLATGPRAWLERRSIVVAALWGARGAEPEPELHADIRDWLGQLARRYGDKAIHFLQIPEKDEVARGALRLPIGDQVRAAGHRYVSLLDACEFRIDHYFPLDPHLRADGYAELRSCVGRVLALLPTHSGRNPPHRELR